MAPRPRSKTSSPSTSSGSPPRRGLEKSLSDQHTQQTESVRSDLSLLSSLPNHSISGSHNSRRRRLQQDDSKPPLSPGKCDESTTHNSSISSLTVAQHFGLAVGVPADALEEEDEDSISSDKKPPAQSQNLPRNPRHPSTRGLCNPPPFEPSRSYTVAEDEDEDDGASSDRAERSPKRKSSSLKNSEPDSQEKGILRKGPTENADAPDEKRSRMLRTLSTPALSSTPSPQKEIVTRNSSYRRLRTSPGKGPRPTISRDKLLRKQTSMTERVNKLRHSASLKQLGRSPSRKQLLGRSKADAANEVNAKTTLPQHLPLAKDKADSRSVNSTHSSRLRRTTMPAAPMRRSLTDSMLDKDFKIPDTISTGNSNHSNSGNRRGVHRSHSSGDILDEEDDDDVLMMIAKARAKLAMEGDCAVGAQATIPEVSQQAQTREDKELQKAATSESSVHSGMQSNTSIGGAASLPSMGAVSLPGAYEKRPGGRFEKKESFCHESITRHSVSAQMRLSATKSQQQDVTGSDMGSISSGDSEDMSDRLEIEFSQHSLSSNEHDSDDDGAKDDGAKKPKATKSTQLDTSEKTLSSATSVEKPSDGHEVAKKPAAKSRSTRSRPVGRSKSFAGLSRRDRKSGSIPHAAACTTTTTSDNESDMSISSRQHRRRRQSGRRRLTRARTHHEGDLRTRMGGSKEMTDDSNQSSISQLVIAAEVVRSEEEMVQELRQKVEKEILESMARELEEMEASMSVRSVKSTAELSSERAQGWSMDISHRSVFSQATDLRIQSPGNGGRNPPRKSSQPRRAASERAFDVFPSPMSNSLPVQPGRRRLCDGPATSSQPTPNGVRRNRSFNLSASSPSFLLGARGRAVREQKVPGQARRMPQILTSSSGSSSDDDSSSSSSSSSVDGSDKARRRNVDIVDALDVEPASHALAARSQSQPALLNDASANSSLTSSRSFVPPYSPFKQGSLLEQLQLLRSSSNAAAPDETPTVTSNTSLGPELRRWGSHGTHQSLPELTQPPSLVDRNSDETRASALTNNSPSLEINLPGRQARGSDEDGQSGQSRPRRQQRASTSSVRSSRRDREDASDVYQGDVEYHVVNTHIESNVPIPSDWQLQQLELAELGQISRGSRPSTFQAIMSSLRAETSAASTGGSSSEPLLITYDNELPTAYATPVCLLAAGAVILGVVLFAV